jgi:3-phenylpropionate/trans-cinnamate dioxygenase ferredoxin component
VSEPSFLAVASLADLPPGGKKAVDVAGRSILLCRDEDRVFALENRCSHADQPLDCGRMRWGWIACPTHGAKFDLETGAPLSPPATEPIAVFPVRVEDGAILVAV